MPAPSPSSQFFQAAWPRSLPSSTWPLLPSPQPDDRYYGHEETAKICSRFVTHLFTCPELVPISSTNPQTPSPPLALFIAYALHRTRLHHSVTFAALYLLLRLKSRSPAVRGPPGHRLFISAFMLASKVICDDTYSNKSWSIVGQGMFTLREINQMEREMCSYLEWQLNVDPSELRDFEHKVCRDFKGVGPYPNYAIPSPAPSPMPSTTPYGATTSRAPPSFVTGHVVSSSRASASTSKPVASPSRSGSQPILIAEGCVYPSPPTSPDTPETPEASRSLSTSPASSASPPTPSDEVDLTVKITTPGGTVPMSVNPSRIAAKSHQPQQLSSSSRVYVVLRAATVSASVLVTTRTKRTAELFAIVQPLTW